MWRDDLRGIYCITLKDMRTYYLKPPAISWGIVFPITWILAFYLRNPGDFSELVPGLVGMTALFSTTAAEAVVINFELRIGSLERLLLAPITVEAVLLGKIVGGALFGLLMTAVVTVSSIFGLGLPINLLYLLLVLVPSVFCFSAMGALMSVLVEQVFEAQTLANLPRFVMVFLSGVVYPISAMPLMLQYVAAFLPLTYTVEGLRHTFLSETSCMPLMDSIVIVAFLAVFIFPATRLLRRRFI